MNGIIIVDKPAGWTSHDVVGKLRGLMRERRVGHGGTLDPMATGVLPVFAGRSTRAVPFCESDQKEYIAGLRLGVVTDTQDITGTVIGGSPPEGGVSLSGLTAVLNGFKGPQLQIPPMYSAVKIEGKKLYELARRGVEVPRVPRSITIFELEPRAGPGEDFTLRIVCSKGTYIRTLCHDIGGKLGCGGVMSSLVRTRSGAFTIDDAVPLDKLIREGADGVLRALRPVDSIFAEHPQITLSAADTERCKNGIKLHAPINEDGLYRVYASDGEFLMLGRVQNATLKIVRTFYEI